MQENISPKPELRSKTCWWLEDWLFSMEISWDEWLPMLPFTRKCCRIRSRSSPTGGLCELKELWNIPFILVVPVKKKWTNVKIFYAVVECLILRVLWRIKFFQWNGHNFEKSFQMIQTKKISSYMKVTVTE